MASRRAPHVDPLRRALSLTVIPEKPHIYFSGGAIRHRPSHYGDHRVRAVHEAAFMQWATALIDRMGE